MRLRRQLTAHFTKLRELARTSSAPVGYQRPLAQAARYTCEIYVAGTSPFVASLRVGPRPIVCLRANWFIRPKAQAVGKRFGSHRFAARQSSIMGGVAVTTREIGTIAEKDAGCAAAAAARHLSGVNYLE